MWQTWRASAIFMLLLALLRDFLPSSEGTAFPVHKVSLHGRPTEPTIDVDNFLSSTARMLAADATSISNGDSKVGRLEELKKKESELAELLAAVRREKLEALQSRPLTIGIVGFGRFGQFIARHFSKYGRVVVTSRTDYTDVANSMNAKYVPLSDPDAFLDENLDVIVLAVSIVSFRPTVERLAPFLERYLQKRNAVGDSGHGPLIVDVLSVKEHPRQVMLELLPEECDILCTHPMFGPDSGANGWHDLNFVYEKTRIDKVVLDPTHSSLETRDSFLDARGKVHSVHENSEAHVESIDRMERFLSIWEEEGCRMVPLSCREHDAFAAESQFITHLMGRILGAQGLSQTPIDTKGFESVLQLIDSTTADSFDLFYGLYKYNQNSMDTIVKLRSAMDDVVENLQKMEEAEKEETQESQAVNEVPAAPATMIHRGPKTYLDSLSDPSAPRFAGS